MISKNETNQDIEKQIKVLNQKFKLSITHIPHDFALFEFAETEAIPIYSFLVCAGNFLCIEEMITEEHEKKGYFKI